jgi:hypothetical protein
MKEKFLPWFLLFCALGLSGSAAYYSVLGLSVVFSGVALPVIIMGSFLEISKLAIATYLHDKWKETYGVLKIYMTTALITLSVITSLGIYGLLSTGFQENIAKLEINNKEVKNIELKKKRFEEIKDELGKEKTVLDGDITKLRDGLSNNTTTQTVDRRTGQLITRANNANRRTFENQLKEAQIRRDTLSKKIDAFNDSITNLDVSILTKESEEIEGSELGTIKYLSEILGWDIKKTANLFILILIFVFDPLAITLVIATNQAFKRNKKDEDNSTVNTPQVHHNYPPSTPQVEDDTNVTHKEEKDQVEREYEVEYKTQDPIIIEKIVEVPVEVIKEVEKIVEVPVYIEKHDTPVEELFETENIFNLQKNNDDEPETEIKDETEVQNEPKRLSYTNRNGGSFRIDRF